MTTDTDKQRKALENEIERFYFQLQTSGPFPYPLVLEAAKRQALTPQPQIDVNKK